LPLLLFLVEEFFPVFLDKVFSSGINVFVVIFVESFDFLDEEGDEVLISGLEIRIFHIRTKRSINNSHNFIKMSFVLFSGFFIINS
jgi:hypothetical protein